jgi:uncharacterized protein
MSPEQPDISSLYQPLDSPGLSRDDSFTFDCRPELPCFNQCCRTPTVLLSPYDLLRLRQGLELTAAEILQRYTRQEIEPQSNLPLVFLDPGRGEDGACPFVGPQGCTVYEHRPAACRLFPLTMGSRLTDEGLQDYYFCRTLDYCRGFDTETRWTVASWQANQGFGDYDRGRRPWIELLLRAGLADQPPGLDPVIQDLFATLAYDLDKFRRLVSDPVFIEAYGLDEKDAARLATDDAALLDYSYRLLPDLLTPKGARRLIEVIRRSPKFFEID